MAYLETVKAAFGKYSKELTLIGTFFVVVVTISNITYTIFGFSLLPIFEVTFAAFHDWCHYLLQILVFSWLTFLLEWLWYILVWTISLIFPVIPWHPDIVVPELVTDFALVSLAFTRVFQSADLIVPRAIRAEAESNTSADQWSEIRIAEGRFWGPIHRFLERVNSGIWNMIDIFAKKLTNPIRRFPKLSLFVRRMLVTVAGSVLMWGFIRISGYLINIPAARHLTSPIMDVRRRLFKYFLLNLVGAIIATAAFFVLNGWLVDYTGPKLNTNP